MKLDLTDKLCNLENLDNANKLNPVSPIWLLSKFKVYKHSNIDVYITRKS